MAKYTGEQRKKLKARLQELGADITAQDLAVKLNEEGFTTNKGTAFTESTAAYVRLNVAKIRKLRRANSSSVGRITREKAEANGNGHTNGNGHATDKTDKAALQDIVLDAKGISDAQKIRILRELRAN